MTKFKRVSSNLEKKGGENFSNCKKGGRKVKEVSKIYSSFLG